jgi:ABC-type Fe3+-hydroxamate transport system substrate-binding protein
LVAVLLAAALAATAACADPQNIHPKPGETTTTTRTNPPTTAAGTTTGADETEQVCAEATSISDDAVEEITEKLEQAQTAANAGNNAGALAAVNEARRIATDWKSDLEDLSRRPIRSDVRATLEDGVETIDRILTTNPQNLNPQQAERDIREFLEDLERVCA